MKHTKRDPAATERMLEHYVSLLSEIERFVESIGRHEQDMAERAAELANAKEDYDAARRSLNVAGEAREGAKHALFMFLRPGPAKILPLFDRMERPDETRHGHGAKEWRQEPITALRLSLASTEALTAADVILIGQLQDRILASPDAWWEPIPGLTAATAAAIADRLVLWVEEHK